MKYSPRSRLLRHRAGCISFCPITLWTTACSQVLASTALSRTKMKFSSQVLLVGRAATSRRMAYSPLHPTALKSWELVAYIDWKMIYPKNPAMHRLLNGRRGNRPENWIHKSQQLETKELQLKLSRPLAIRHTSRGCLMHAKRLEINLAAGCSFCYLAAFHWHLAHVIPLRCLSWISTWPWLSHAWLLLF